MIVNSLLSVIIPACDAAAFIADAIGSVLAQTGHPIEIIVVDDGSVDGTARIAENFGPPVICHRQENGGPPAARNQGLAMARGEYIGFLDADDLFAPGSFEIQIGKLRDNPGAEIVIGRLLREELASRPGEPAMFTPLETQADVNLQLGACMFRRSVFDRVGLMDISLRHSDDWDWFMRARELGVEMLMHQELVLRQRLHRSNLTRDQAANLHFLSVMLKRSLDRRRAASGNAQILPQLASYREHAGPNGDADNSDADKGDADRGDAET